MQPIAELAALAHARSVPFHTDAVQAAGWLDLDVRGARRRRAQHLRSQARGARKASVRCSCAGASRSSRCIHGGGQERGRRSGTENVAGAVGAGGGDPARGGCPGGECGSRRRRRGTRSSRRCLREVPDARLTGHPSARLPGTASFVFPGTSGESGAARAGAARDRSARADPRAPPAARTPPTCCSRSVSTRRSRRPPCGSRGAGGRAGARRRRSRRRRMPCEPSPRRPLTVAVRDYAVSEHRAELT